MAAEEGARAMAEAARQAIEIRKNMARFRELRETREADAATRLVPLPAPSKKRTRKLPR
nr:transcriptional regulator [Bradyrhizobium ivorense]